MNRPVRNFSRSGQAFCIEKYNVSHSGHLAKYTAPATKVTFELHQVLRLPRKVTLEFHQVLRRRLSFTKYFACHEE